MREMIMKGNFVKAFRKVIILAVVLAILSTIVVPLSLSRQISDVAALARQEQVRTGGEEEHGDREELWKSQITPLSAVNYAVLGGTAILWLALVAYYWLLVMAWLYKNAVNEGMNKSLWPILGLFTNLLAVFAFLIVRDNPRRVKPQTVK